MMADYHKTVGGKDVRGGIAPGDIPTHEHNYEPKNENIQAHILNSGIHVTPEQKAGFHVHGNKEALDYIHNRGEGNRFLNDKAEYVLLNLLPNGAINQTLWHDGTQWVVSKNLTINETATATAWRIQSSTAPTQCYIDYVVKGASSSIRIASDGTNRAMTLSATSTQINCKLQFSTLQYIENRVTGDEQVIRVVPRGSTADALVLRTTSVHTPLERAIRYGEHFYIRQDGTINSKALSGTTVALIEATAEGTMQRSSVEIPPAQIQSDWNQTDDTQPDYIKNKPSISQRRYAEYISPPITGDMFSINTPALGIMGDARIKIKMMQAVCIDPYNNLNSSIIRAEVRLESRLDYYFVTGLNGDYRLKLYIEYID